MYTVQVTYKYGREVQYDGISRLRIDPSQLILFRGDEPVEVIEADAIQSFSFDTEIR